MTLRQRERIRVRVTAEDPKRVLRDIREGLVSTPREISPRFFYDDHGSELFEKITELPEYYPTRTETAILASIADELEGLTGAQELIELGSGAATKTRVLLDAMHDSGNLRRYIPFDVSEGIVRRVAGELLAEYPELIVHAVIGDFSTHLDEIPDGRRRLCLFLGGTIGNFKPEEGTRFLEDVHGNLDAGDHLLLGTDLIKDRDRLHAAYNDRRGVTAAFNRNCLSVLNALTGGDFDPEAFAHEAFYREPEHRIEMWLRASGPQHVRLPGIGLELDLAEGERIRTEISTKYDQPKVEAMLAGGGFELVRFWTDPDALFALSLARRA
jgi:L-histidine N-alpha-methyltransferase